MKLPKLQGKVARIVREYKEEEKTAEMLFVRNGVRLWWLQENRDKYRETHDTFEAFVKDHLGVTARRAEQLMKAAKFVRQIEAQNANKNDEFVRISPPQNEGQTRPLIEKLETDEERMHVWNQVQARAETAGQRITAALVQEEVDAFLADPVPLEPLPEVKIDHGLGKAHVSKNSGENEWYTPSHILDAARAVMGGIDLDPATSELANQTVGAQMIYTEADNGLEKHWPACRIWMNPPYAQPLISQFSTKLREAVEGGAIAIVLVNNATETKWFQEMAGVCSAICFPNSRIKFVAPDGRLSAPLQGQAIIYSGPDADKFEAEFSYLGLVVRHG